MLVMAKTGMYGTMAVFLPGLSSHMVQDDANFKHDDVLCLGLDAVIL